MNSYSRGRSSVIRLDKAWIDIDPTFARAWNGDVAVETGEHAVKNTILGILMTRKGQRPFYPEFGCNLTDELFELMDPAKADNIERNIIAALTAFEPRIDVRNVVVKWLYDSNTIEVTIIYNLKSNEDHAYEYKFELDPKEFNPSN